MVEKESPMEGEEKKGSVFNQVKDVVSALLPFWTLMGSESKDNRREAQRMTD